MISTWYEQQKTRRTDISYKIAGAVAYFEHFVSDDRGILGGSDSKIFPEI